MNKTIEELLGAFVDLSAQKVTIRHPGPGGKSGSRWQCRFCGDFAETPPQIRHVHMCIVAQGRDYLAEERK